MSEQLTSAADFDVAVVNHPDTAPPPYSSSSTSATTDPPHASSSTKMNPEENAAQFIARMGLFDGQGKNADILSFIIIANLVAANPDTKELTLSNAEVATLSITSISFIEQLKAAIKEQDSERSDEWDKLDSDFIRMLFQYIVSQQDTEGNSYKAWIPVCQDVRPYFRAYGKNPFCASTIDDAKEWWYSDKPEGIRGNKDHEVKGYGAFMAIWLPIFGTEEERKKGEVDPKMYADRQKCDDEIAEFARAVEKLRLMLKRGTERATERV